MYMQVIAGWRYRPGVRRQVEARLAHVQVAHGGATPLSPDAPGLIARMWATDPDDRDEGIAIWLWESKAAADAYEHARHDDEPVVPAEQVETELDTDGVVVRGLDCMYFGHR